MGEQLFLKICGERCNSERNVFIKLLMELAIGFMKVWKLEPLSTGVLVSPQLAIVH